MRELDKQRIEHRRFVFRQRGHDAPVDRPELGEQLLVQALTRA
jgi:hypothetical protein